jgi:hypothetical protein
MVRGAVRRPFTKNRASHSAIRGVKSSCDDTDSSCLPGARLPANHNLDILIERRQEVH